MKKISLIVASVVLPMLPLIALAQIAPPTPPTGVSSVAGVWGIFKSVINAVVIIFWLLSGIFIIYAAFLYLTAGGEEEKITKANATLKYAVVAIVVALLATVLPSLVGSFLNTGATSIQ